MHISTERHETPLSDKYKEANMEKRTIYISNDPHARDEAIENAMIRIAEETDTQILIEDLKKSSSSRYSGSQSPKHIRGNSSASIEFDVTLHMPPLLGVSTRNLRFSEKCSTQVLTIASQGKWNLKLKDGCDNWVSINKCSGSGESTKVSITVKELTGDKTRDAVLQLTHEQDGPAGGECIEIGVTQSPNIKG